MADKRKTHTSSAVKNRWSAKARDSITIVVPKGRKQDIKDYLDKHGSTINTEFNRIFREMLGMSEVEWKARTVTVDAPLQKESPDD